MANASRSPARSGCAASPRKLPAMLSHSCGLAAPTVCGLFHPAHSTSCCDLPGPVRWSVSAEKFSCPALLLRCYSFSLPVSFDLCFQALQITWELTASRRRPAFSSHLLSTAIVLSDQSGYNPEQWIIHRRSQANAEVHTCLESLLRR